MPIEVSSGSKLCCEKRHEIQFRTYFRRKHLWFVNLGSPKLPFHRPAQMNTTVKSPAERAEINWASCTNRQFLELLALSILLNLTHWTGIKQIHNSNQMKMTNDNEQWMFFWLFYEGWGKSPWILQNPTTMRLRTKPQTYIFRDRKPPSLNRRSQPIFCVRLQLHSPQ
jgi:hypothetical protein